MLKKKIGALKLASRHLNQKYRLRLANGVVLSNNALCDKDMGVNKEEWIRNTQRTQNIAARYVFKAGIFISGESLKCLIILVAHL